MNNENNNLDMKQPMNEKEFYVKKLEKYEELNEQESKSLLSSMFMAFGGIIILSMSKMYEPYSYDVLYPIIVGSAIVAGSIFGTAITIARKVGLESRINEIKEILELYKLQNNHGFEENIEDINYQKEKVRHL